MQSGPPPWLVAAVTSYASALRARFGDRLRTVRLFGSWARGAAGPDSDIDVAVIVDDLSRAEWRAAFADAVDVELKTEVTLSPYVLSAEDFDRLLRRGRRIARDIEREGIAA